MNVLDQEIDEGPDTCGKMFVTGIHGVNEFDIFRIIGFQYSHQRSGIDIRLYMELTHTSEAKAGEVRAYLRRVLESARRQPPGPRLPGA